MTIENKNNVILIVLVFLVLLITVWSLYHGMESHRYKRALIDLGVHNCQRINQLETFSYRV